MLGASLNSENAHRKHKSTKNTPLNTSEKDWFTVQELKQEGRTCEETFCPALHMSVKVPPTSIGFGVQGEIQQVGERVYLVHGLEGLILFKCPYYAKQSTDLMRSPLNYQWYFSRIRTLKFT